MFECTKLLNPEMSFVINVQSKGSPYIMVELQPHVRMRVEDSHTLSKCQHGSRIPEHYALKPIGF